MIDLYDTLIEFMSENEAHKRFHTGDYSGVDFGARDLRLVDFRGCDLRGANLSKCIVDMYTCFDYAVIDKTTKMPDYPMACPTEGEFIGWKKAFTLDFQPVIIKLLIPADAKRSSATGNKCRCSKAKVLSIKNYANKNLTLAIAMNNYLFKYPLNEIVMPDSFDECRWHECASGIHFFINKEDAINY